MEKGDRRYRAWWIERDDNPPDAEGCDPDLLVEGKRYFDTLQKAAQYARHRCLCESPRVYVEEYHPFWDGNLVPSWDEVGVYYVEPETGDVYDDGGVIW